MDNPRPEKVAVVNEVRDAPRRRPGPHPHRVPGTHRRRAGRAAPGARGGRRRLQGLQEHPGEARHRRRAHEPLESLLAGPTGIAFVTGEISAVAKALRDYARTNPHLVVKGGHRSASDVLSASDLSTPRRPAVSRRAPRPVRGCPRCADAAAGRRCIQALPRNLAYGLSALWRSTGRAGSAARSDRSLRWLRPAEATPKPSTGGRSRRELAEAPARSEHRAATAAADEATAAGGSTAEPADDDAAPRTPDRAAPPTADRPHRSNR